VGVTAFVISSKILLMLSASMAVLKKFPTISRRFGNAWMGDRKKEIIGEVELLIYCKHSRNVRCLQLQYYSHLNLFIL
jgi:hypothetical protein